MYDSFVKLAQKKGVTAYKVAKETGLSQQVFTNWKSGRSQPSQSTLRKIAEYFGVSVDYLVTGREPQPAGFDNLFPVRTKRLPLLGEIACGEPIYADEQHGEFVSTDEGLEADFCLRAKGDSMVGARIHDGDVVFVRKQDAVENGEIAAVVIEDEATLKRVYYYPDDAKLVLSPENPRYAPLVYVGEELDRIRILGRAVAFQSKIR